MKAETKNLGCIREAWRMKKPSVIQPTPLTDTGTYLTGRTKLFRKSGHQQYGKSKSVFISHA